MYVKLSIFAVVSALIVYYIKHYHIGDCICNSNSKLHGKTVIITGGNSGIGKETAVDLAKRGAKVIIGCRNLKRADVALEEIRQESGNTDVHLKEIDLSSLSSVNKFAKEIIANEERLDILINNAGIAFVEQNKTEDGFEMHFGVNHLGHFLLTNLLLDLIKKSTPSRIITVSSRAYHVVKGINFDDINLKKEYSSVSAYGHSKLANILFAYELNKRLQGSGVSTFSLHPGIVVTNISRHLSMFKYKMIEIIAKPIMDILFQDARKGAQTTICCAVEQNLERLSGQFFFNCKPDLLTLSDNESKKLWEVSEKMVEKYLET